MADLIDQGHGGASFFHDEPEDVPAAFAAAQYRLVAEDDYCRTCGGEPMGACLCLPHPATSAAVPSPLPGTGQFTAPQGRSSAPRSGLTENGTCTPPVAPGDRQGDVERLRKALEPFVREEEHWRDIPGVIRCDDDVELWQNPGRRVAITVGDLRRARAALASTSEAATTGGEGAAIARARQEMRGG